MITTNDLFISFKGIANNDEIIDSYDMIQKIMIELGGQNNFPYKIDNTLPLIKGDPNKIEEIFRNFISNALDHFQNYEGQLRIIHIKNSKSWIFAFLEIPFQVNTTKQKTTIETISQFTLAISKKVFKKDEEISKFIETLNIL